MDIHISEDGPIVMAQVAGVLNADSAESFTEALRDYAVSEGRGLAVDLSRLTLIDSSGLAALVNLVTRARLSNARVVLVAPSAFVSGILGVTRLDTWFEVCDGFSQARRLLHPG